ncbi:MAG: hypothetical protein K940chlam7_01341 [Chlamydiae bacterium]|nr:hypothetical protein [Chlamydiota bacterium]
MAKYLSIFVVVALVLASYLIFNYAKETYRIFPIEEEKSPVSLEVYNFQNWHEFTGTNGEFKVLFPTLPQHATENIKDPKSNETRKYEMYVSEKDDGTIFMISLITFPDKTADSDGDSLMRAMMNDMMAASPDNELRTMESGKYKGYNSLDFAFGNNELSVDSKTFMVNNTMLVLTRIVKTENYNTNEFNFFINSFELSSASPSAEQTE